MNKLGEIERTLVEVEAGWPCLYLQNDLCVHTENVVALLSASKVGDR